jgi:hypothetical protein
MRQEGEEEAAARHQGAKEQRQRDACSHDVALRAAGVKRSTS